MRSAGSSFRAAADWCRLAVAGVREPVGGHSGRLVGGKWLVAAIAASVLAVGCGKHEQAAVRVGMLAPLTGNGARFGESQRNGVLLAIEQLNAQGGVLGRSVELVVEDTKTEPPVAVTAFARLAERPELLCIIGSAASLDVPAYLPRVDQAGIPHILPVAVLPKITEFGSKWTFRNALNDRVAAEKMAEFATGTLGAKSVALLIEDSAFGETGLEFARRCVELGVTPLSTERFRRGDVDVRPQLTKIRATGATHIQFWGYYAEYALVAKQLLELDYDVQLMGNQAPVNDKTIELAGDALEGALNVCLFVATSQKPSAQAFVAAYRQRYGEVPDTWAAQSYDGMMLVADAIRRGGAVPTELRDALASTSDYHGVTGDISFGPDGDARFSGTHVVVVRSGRFVPYE